VPDLDFIQNLYGVPFPSTLRSSWPALPELNRWDDALCVADSIQFDTASVFANDVAVRLNGMFGRQMKRLVRKMSPFSQPKLCYGFHAARFEFAIKYFDIKFESLLDLGSHPGACAASGTKYCEDIVCVSKKPSKDSGDFCPYVARSGSIQLIVGDANSYVPSRQFELMHDDVDIVGPRSAEEDIEIGLGMIDRALKNSKSVNQALITIKEVNWRVKDQLYYLYKEYGHFDIVKPYFSNPWKSEFMVYVRHDKTPRMRKASFIRKLNGFLNLHASSIFQWNELLTSAISGVKGIGDVEAYPAQTDVFEGNWVKPWH
jgi:hypothetical protein